MAPHQVIPACPECGKNDFKDMRGRGTHRRFKHGVEGKSAKYNKAAKTRREQIAAQDVPKRKYTKRNVEEFPTQQTQEVDIVFETQVSFAYGHCKAWLEVFANGSGISEPILAGRVAELLHDASRGKVLGTRNKVPTMRPKAA